MALRAIPIRRAGNRENLFMGGDRELVMFSGLLAGALIFSAQEVRATVFGIALWFGALFALRLMAKADRSCDTCTCGTAGTSHATRLAARLP